MKYRDQELERQMLLRWEGVEVCMGTKLAEFIIYTYVNHPRWKKNMRE